MALTLTFDSGKSSITVPSNCRFPTEKEIDDMHKLGIHDFGEYLKIRKTFANLEKGDTIYYLECGSILKGLKLCRSIVVDILPFSSNGKEIKTDLPDSFVIGNIDNKIVSVSKRCIEDRDIFTRHYATSIDDLKDVFNVEPEYISHLTKPEFPLDRVVKESSSTRKPVKSERKSAYEGKSLAQRLAEKLVMLIYAFLTKKSDYGR